eukprot:CAMPEP_0179443780 /NCGR_PEP_ID=MMETSP0799-20121207/27246_1 /TAXON_ID=46947 /ORGANISM="Geminigera cryophila, Strain CCMP2564" /LENGTH=73 /DNA_ID=CAMNT_0021230205 /DNA_START=517 /DNA_END=738 /DNA_ORIENTATION=-
MSVIDIAKHERNRHHHDHHACGSACINKLEGNEHMPLMFMHAAYATHRRVLASARNLRHHLLTCCISISADAP